MKSSSYNGNGASVGNGPDAPWWTRDWQYQQLLEVRVTIWTVMP